MKSAETELKLYILIVNETWRIECSREKADSSRLMVLIRTFSGSLLSRRRTLALVFGGRARPARAAEGTGRFQAAFSIHLAFPVARPSLQMSGEAVPIKRMSMIESQTQA